MEQPARRSSLWLLVPLVVIFATAAAGNALFPALVTSHPLVLLALNATTRHLVATANSVDVVPYVTVALARRLVEDPVLYLLGRRYGDGAGAWLGRRLGAGRLLHAVRHRFRVGGLFLVFFFPGGVVCVLAGASGMPLWLFLALNVAGTLVTIFLLRSAGEEFEGPLTQVLDIVGDNVVTLTIVSAVVTLAVVARRRRQAGPSDGAELARLEADRRHRQRD